jgi:8-oxo-dGTP pyrophosphatase MutT (NUDIX family)
VAEPRRGGAQRIPRPTSNRPGSPAPWAAIAPERRRLTLDGIRDALEAAPAPRRASSEVDGAGEQPGFRASAVLVPLYEHEGQVWVVLTRRAQHLRSHRGEVSFPGGGREGSEALVDTALREAQEEIGLDPGTVEVVGELDHLRTFLRRSSITPFVGFLPGRPELTPNPSEVALILHVALDELLDEQVYREERWGLPPLDHPMHFFELVGDTIWGATGRMLVELLALVTGSPPPPPMPGALAP